VNHFSRLARLGATVTVLGMLLSACSMIETDRVDYKSAAKAPTLEIPPDLTQLNRDTRYNIPGGSVTASGYQVSNPSQSAPIAADVVGDVRIERSGNQHWLVVNRPPEKIWDTVRDFWQDSGFLLTIDQSNLGILETDWAENRAKLPQDFIRNTVGKVFSNLYSTGERDRFRTRLERTATGTGTEIYISHRGLIEVYNSSRQDQTVWQPRPVEPELETEFLRRLMVRLGVTQEQAKSLQATAVKTTARVSSVNGQPVVLVDENFERAWRRVGLSLDRTGFTVEDRDRAQGLYFVRYVEPSADKNAPGFFAKLFGGSAKEPAPLKYRISVKSVGESTTVAVLDGAGAPEASETAQRIVKVIADDLR
jgi:outer membrane protein assembly factor BamC